MRLYGRIEKIARASSLPDPEDDSTMLKVLVPGVPADEWAIDVGDFIVIQRPDATDVLRGSEE